MLDLTKSEEYSIIKKDPIINVWQGPKFLVKEQTLVYG